MINLSKLFVVPHRCLKLLAALTWYGGSIALCIKASSLLAQARNLKPEEEWLWVATIGGIAVGALKGELLFNRSCQKNLARISALVQPLLWQFFKPSFFLFMSIMILFGATLSRFSHNNYPFLLIVAFIDLTIAVALLLSSRNFWN